MEPTKKSGSHIRERIEYNDETASQTLDNYYKLHVRKHDCCARNPQKEWLRRFRQTHYFGPNYWSRPAAKSQSRRLDELHRQIREAKDMIEFKTKQDHQNRCLDQLTTRLARQTLSPKATKAATKVTKATKPSKATKATKAVAQVETPQPMELSQEKPQPQPLVLMIGDEILYDEEYKRDPLWEQGDDDDDMV